MKLFKRVTFDSNNHTAKKKKKSLEYLIFSTRNIQEPKDCGRYRQSKNTLRLKGVILYESEKDKALESFCMWNVFLDKISLNHFNRTLFYFWAIAF